jgi:hypothetical protein
MIRVYIASPYTNGDVAENVRAQMDAADRLMDLGFCPIVPLYSHFQHIFKPRPYEDWMKIDLAKLEMCDIVLRLPGYSPGADLETEHAAKVGIPVARGWDEFVEWHSERAEQ